MAEDVAEVSQDIAGDVKKGEEPGKISDKLDSLWLDVDKYLNQTEADFKQISSKLSQIVHDITDLLVIASNSGGDQSILACEFCQKNNMYNKIYNWTGLHRECLRFMAHEQLRYFNRIIKDGDIQLITLNSVVIPMMLLLMSLKPTDKRKVPPDIEKFYVSNLHHISQRILHSKKFLDLLSNDLYTNEGFKIPKFTFFELLISYTHHAGENGRLARQGILDCVQISRTLPSFEKYIVDSSAACVIITGGLSARFSSLPMTLEIHEEDWHYITVDDLHNIPELQSFLQALDYCCEITEASNPSVRSHIGKLIYDGFLMSVLAPALNQSQFDAQIAVMAYLDLFLRSITSTKVMEVFLRVLMTDAYENKALITLLIYHINSESVQLSMVAIQLFKTLLELNCEDIIFHLLFRYLLPCHHILPNQKKTIKSIDYYCKSATMFLYLTPSCCIETKKHKFFQEHNLSCGHDSPRSNRSTISKKSGNVSHTSKASGDNLSHNTDNISVKSETSNVSNKNSNTTDRSSLSNLSIDNSPQNRRRSPQSVRKISSHSTSSRSSNLSIQPDLPREDTLDFMTYLQDARANITICKRACKCWSAVYDGMDVDTDDRKSSSNLQRSSSSVTSPAPVFGRTLSESSDSSLENSKFPEVFTSDILGPFFNAIFDKLESMLENNVYVNLQLTGLVARLACYPQPLLRSFLLNANLVIRPGVRSLALVIKNVSDSVDNFISRLDDYKLLITKARRNLVNRTEQSSMTADAQENYNEEDGEEKPDVEYTISVNHTTGSTKYQQKELQPEKSESGISADELVSLTPTSTLTGSSQVSVNTSILKREENYSKKSSTISNPGNVGRLHPVLPKFGAKGTRSRSKFHPTKSEIVEMRRKNPTLVKNAVYCAVVLEEFMKELAAISIEHTLQ